MEPNSKRREDYRKKRSSLNLHRNHVLAAPTGALKGNLFARVCGIVIVLCVSCGLAWAAHMYFALHSAIDGQSGNSATSALIAQRKPISILILGVDQGLEGRHDKGNSDTLILATANPGKNKATMTSIPRDTLANILGDPGDKYNMFRVNSAYGIGGSKASMRTVSALLDVPINYYVEVNMKALKSLVNAVGGVDVNVPFDFSYDWCDFRKGKQHLNGRHAVAYVRMRHDDPRGDYGRQMRQRQVINAVVHKAISVDSIANYRNLVKIFTKYVRTNLTFNDMLALALTYRGCSQNIDSGYIQGHDAWINGSSIQVVSTAELQKASNKIRTNLDLEKKVLDNDETKLNKLNEQNNNIKWKDPNPFTNYQIYHSVVTDESENKSTGTDTSDDNSTGQ
ncbi:MULTISPECIES: LCP family protein [unclassified Lactobacillus]|uniref:LCP family glycopolymer transferase n=1 Tax=unclassified Lactobacillus TaxID=2620435 RepID=UPI00226A3B10|nr:MULTISPECIES: LCP family protein [unclassified Lactobacillus]MCX8720344.1 LCP family protein [Lactobacillus sp. B4010]MCX8732837.1 LCP family protein [Lactobacillus sp. B4015]MCX8735110.1 LCP family protein [Lactobacillus sp. B4012]